MVQTFTYTQSERETKLFLSEQLCPGSLWILSLVRVDTKFFLRSIGLSLGLLASLGTLSPGAKSYSKNPKAKHC